MKAHRLAKGGDCESPEMIQVSTVLTWKSCKVRSPLLSPDNWTLIMQLSSQYSKADPKRVAAASKSFGSMTSLGAGAPDIAQVRCVLY